MLFFRQTLAFWNPHRAMAPGGRSLDTVGSLKLEFQTTKAAPDSGGLGTPSESLTARGIFPLLRALTQSLNFI
jgi:hypothetical protein